MYFEIIFEIKSTHLITDKTIFKQFYMHLLWIVHIAEIHCMQ